ncbi:MAG: hypothetical protein JWR40_3267, partial [Massilia sp.]|nr:hypothetical protein [Massilia sp.]
AAICLLTRQLDLQTLLRVSIIMPLGLVAQSVEQRIENPCVGGSIPPRATKNSTERQPLQVGVSRFEGRCPRARSISGSKYDRRPGVNFIMGYAAVRPAGRETAAGSVQPLGLRRISVDAAHGSRCRSVSASRPARCSRPSASSAIASDSTTTTPGMTAAERRWRPSAAFNSGQRVADCDTPVQLATPQPRRVARTAQSQPKIFE